MFPPSASLSEEKFKAVWECAADAMAFLDREGLLDGNEAMLRLFGLNDAGMVLGQPLALLMPARQPTGEDSDGLLQGQIRQAFQQGHARFEGQFRRHDGSTFVADVRLHQIALGGGHILHAVFRDITRRWEAERRLGRVKDAMEASLHQLTYFDLVTGLPNRSQFHDRCELLLRDAAARDSRVALLSLGISDLKQINSSLGHDAGDQVLREMAERLSALLQSEGQEAALLARVSGNEFALLLPGSDAEQAASLARLAVEVAARPLHLAGQSLSIGLAVGISLYGDDARDKAALISHAEAAMYRAKAGGSGTVQFYIGDMNAAALERLRLETSLRQALVRQEFELHYQPLVSVAAGRAVGVEALVRWRHPDLGLLAPDRFIPLAESTGLIVPLGDWVLREACAQAMRWRQAGLPPVEVAVNLAPRQFLKDSLVQGVAAALKTTGLEAAQLVLELTEGALMEDTEHTLRTLADFRAMGIRLAIDDFGTGYSSLAYLKRFPIQKLKVDQSFVRDLRQEDDVVIARAIVELGRNLRLDVVAEGIETPAELELLRSYGCDTMQGFLFARPLPPTEVAGLLTRRLLPSSDSPC